MVEGDSSLAAEVRVSSRVQSDVSKGPEPLGDRLMGPASESVASDLGGAVSVSGAGPIPIAGTLTQPETSRGEFASSGALPVVGSGGGVGSKRGRAEQVVRDHLPLAAGAGMLPLPGIDLLAIGGLQLRVLAALADLYAVPFDRSRAQSIVTTLIGSVGVTYVAGAALFSVAKVIPGLGSVLAAASLPAAGGAITHAVGQLAIDHFEAGGTMQDFDLDLAQQAFVDRLTILRAEVPRQPGLPVSRG